MRQDGQPGKKMYISYLSFFQARSSCFFFALFLHRENLSLLVQKSRPNIPEKPKNSYILDVFADGAVQPPFNVPEITQPIFPARKCNIADYGAIGDGKTKDTAAINKAIDDCSQKGGGQVLIPRGKWLTGAIRLASNIDLHLDDKAEIIFSTDLHDYLPFVFSRYEGIELYNYSPLIYAKDCQNIAITGKGRLVGQGADWLKYDDRHVINALYDMGASNLSLDQRRFDSPDKVLRPPFVQLINCNSIRLADFSIESGPMWTINPVYSQNIVIDGISITTDGKNNDGIDIDSSKNVLIENSHLDTHDDAIALKSGRGKDGLRVDRPTENVIIRNNSMQNGHGGIAIGSEIAAGVENVFAYNCRINSNQYGIRLKAADNEIAPAKNLWFQNMEINNATIAAIQMTMDYDSDQKHLQIGSPDFENISFSDISGNGNKKALDLAGTPDDPIKNISMKNILLESQKGSYLSYVTDSSLIGLEMEAPDPTVLENDQGLNIEKYDCPGKMEVCIDIQGDKTSLIKLADLNHLKNKIRLEDAVDKTQIKFD